MSVGTSGSLSDAQRFQGETGLTSGTVVFDANFRIWGHYGVSGVPTAILFDSSGNQIHNFGGRFQAADVLARI